MTSMPGGMQVNPIKPENFIYELEHTVPLSVATINDDNKKSNKFLKFCEGFFGFRKIAHLSQNGKHLEYTKVPMHQTLLKGVACATIVLPVIFAIGKYIYRSKEDLTRRHLFVVPPNVIKNFDQVLKNYSKEILPYDNIFCAPISYNTSYRVMEGDGSLNVSAKWLNSNINKINTKSLVILQIKGSKDPSEATRENIKDRLVSMGDSANIPQLNNLEVEEVWWCRNKHARKVEYKL